MVHRVKGRPRVLRVKLSPEFLHAVTVSGRSLKSLENASEHVGGEHLSTMLLRGEIIATTASCLRINDVAKSIGFRGATYDESFHEGDSPVERA